MVVDFAVVEWVAMMRVPVMDKGGGGVGAVGPGVVVAALAGVGSDCRLLLPVLGCAR